MSESINKAVLIAAELCRHFEGFRSRPYLCPAGVPTIGYGTVYKPDGTKVTLEHEPITKDTADEWLLSELKTKYMAGVLRESPNLINRPEVLGAITDFVYNLGVGRYRASTLKKRINSEDWTQSRKELMKWTIGGGKVLAGLERRRKAEAIFLPL